MGQGPDLTGYKSEASSRAEHLASLYRSEDRWNQEKSVFRGSNYGLATAADQGL